MTDKNTQDLIRGLRALAGYAFPKQCRSCGRIYLTEEEYILATESLNNGRHGVLATEDYDGSVLVEVYRNCVCGSTLLGFFSDRRNNSPIGNEIRTQSAALLKKLMAEGSTPEQAREQLLAILNRNPLEREHIIQLNRLPPISDAE